MNSIINLELSIKQANRISRYNMPSLYRCKNQEKISSRRIRCYPEWAKKDLEIIKISTSKKNMTQKSLRIY
jgi:hypothetical protein